jgi:L-ascorbate metabolism protein UlaG (beta-lactamase superfamily)
VSHTLVHLLAVAAIASIQAPRPALQARFIGNMAFAITDGTVTLMSDFPYQSGYSRYNTYARSEIRSTTATTLSLITHRHLDHWEPSLFNGTGWKVAGPADVVTKVPADRIVRLGAQTTFGPLTIERLVTPHARVEHHSYVVTWHGRRLYFSGDTDSTDSLAAAKNLDVAFISPWMFRSMAKQGRPIDAKRIVIYHHQDGERVEGCGSGCTLPRQGDTLRIE